MDNAASQGLPLVSDVAASFDTRRLFDRVPHYSLREVPPFHCARYARYIARDLFGKNYAPADAWNLRYHNGLTLDVTDDIESLVHSGQLKPGMIVGIYNPRSCNNQRKDEIRQPIRYSHVAVFLGASLFAHQFSFWARLDTSKQIQMMDFRFREVIDSLS